MVQGNDSNNPGEMGLNLSIPFGEDPLPLSLVPRAEYWRVRATRNWLQTRKRVLGSETTQIRQTLPSFLDKRIIVFAK